MAEVPVDHVPLQHSRGMQQINGLITRRAAGYIRKNKHLQIDEKANGQQDERNRLALVILLFDNLCRRAHKANFRKSLSPQ
jgi:hypothetical protein